MYLLYYEIGHGCHGFDVSGCAQSQAATSQLQTVEIFQREQLALIEEGKAVRAGGFHMISWRFHGDLQI